MRDPTISVTAASRSVLKQGNVRGARGAQSVLCLTRFRLGLALGPHGLSSQPPCSFKPRIVFRRAQAGHSFCLPVSSLSCAYCLPGLEGSPSPVEPRRSTGRGQRWVGEGPYPVLVSRAMWVAQILIQEPDRTPAPAWPPVGAPAKVDPRLASRKPPVWKGWRQTLVVTSYTWVLAVTMAARPVPFLSSSLLTLLQAHGPLY